MCCAWGQYNPRMQNTVVIAGAGHAAGQTIVSLRQGGFAGRIVLVGEEPYLPVPAPAPVEEVPGR